MHADPELVGIPVQADETRTAAVCTRPDGEQRIVIAARGYVLIVHPGSGECRQLYFPDGENEYPYASISGPDGRFYTGAGRRLLVIDPFRCAFIAVLDPAPDEEIVGMAFAVDAQGGVYATTYPGCRLVHFDPAAGTCRELARLDPEQKYAMSLAADRHGWLYAGIGTERRQLAAYHPASGMLRTLVHEPDRLRGSGYVYAGSDGAVYGHAGEWDDAPAAGAGKSRTQRWLRFADGASQPIAEANAAPQLLSGSGFHRLYGNLAGAERITGVRLEDGEITLADRLSGRPRVLRLQYASRGADVSPIAAGPDGKLYGTSNHPLHFFRWDPQDGRLINYGGQVIERGGGGNICAYAAQGPYLVGAAYAGGHIHRYDTRLPVSGGASGARNPLLIASHPEIHRPRCALAHPDGEHVLFGGFPGYGAVGGGLAIVHVPTGRSELWPHERLVPDQSTMGLALLPDGRIAGCTSVETPGGAEPRARAAEIYILDWERRIVQDRAVPFLEAREISLLVTDRFGRLHGLTSDSLYFVYEPKTRQVVQRIPMTRYGSVVRDGMAAGTDGYMYALLRHAIWRIDPCNLSIAVLKTPDHPITAGIALLDGCLYYASGSRLMKYRLLAP